MRAVLWGHIGNIWGFFLRCFLIRFAHHHTLFSSVASQLLLITHTVKSVCPITDWRALCAISILCSLLIIVLPFVSLHWLSSPGKLGYPSVVGHPVPRPKWGRALAQRIPPYSGAGGLASLFTRELGPCWVSRPVIQLNVNRCFQWSLPMKTPRAFHQKL